MKDYLLERATTIEPLGAHRVRVVFADGFTATLDLSPLLDDGPIIAPLKNSEFFAQVKVERGALVWSDEVDHSPGSLRAWSEAGRVLSRDETDEWVTRNGTAPEQVA